MTPIIFQHYQYFWSYPQEKGNSQFFQSFLVTHEYFGHFGQFSITRPQKSPGSFTFSFRIFDLCLDFFLTKHVFGHAFYPLTKKAKIAGFQKICTKMRRNPNNPKITQTPIDNIFEIDTVAIGLVASF